MDEVLDKVVYNVSLNKGTNVSISSLDLIDKVVAQFNKNIMIYYYRGESLNEQVSIRDYELDKLVCKNNRVICRESDIPEALRLIKEYNENKLKKEKASIIRREEIIRNIICKMGEKS